MQTAAASAQPRSRGPISPGALGTVTGRMKSSRVALRADAIAAEVREEMQAAVDFGLASPFPEVETALDHVYA